MEPGNQLVAGEELRMRPRFLVWAEGCDGGIAGGRLDLGVKTTRLRLWCLWEIQVETAP